MSEENKTPSSNNSNNTAENKTPSSSNTVEKETEISSSSKKIRSRSLKSSEEKQIINSASKEKQKFTTNEALNEYYRLKDKYESIYYDKYIKPIIKSNKSKKEKRVEFSRLPKHECINCKRNVGTIFSVYLNEERVKKFIAKCGDLSDPCPLDIQIDYSYREQFDDNINSGLKMIEDIKLRIIKEKNNALFFNEKVVDIFNDLTEELKNETENTGFLIETNILKNNNPAKKQLLNKSIDEFGKECILPFKQMISEYLEKNDELKMNEAVNFYINEMMPKLKEIQELKYNVNYVEYEENYDTGSSVSSVYKLIQLPNSLENTEFCIESDDKVLKFVMGVKKSKKAKTMKSGLTEKSLKKTRKIIPTLIIEDEETEFVSPKDKEVGEEGEEGEEGE